MEIVNYSTRQFFTLPVKQQLETLEILKFVKTAQTPKKVWELKLKEVSHIKDTYGQPDMWGIVHIMALLGHSDPLALPILDFFPQYWGVGEQLEHIAKIESKLQLAEPDPRAEMVGYSEKMAKFGAYNTLIPLAKSLNLTLKEVNDMDYGEVYAILLYETTQSNLQAEINKIKPLQ